jgi:glycosyltransferase involved in cell wall biosynthesis
MNILHIASSDTEGGASRAAHRLHRELTKLGVNSRMFVRKKGSGNSDIRSPGGAFAKSMAVIAPFLDWKLTKTFYPRKEKGLFSCNMFLGMNIPADEVERADLIHLHWLGTGAVNFSDIKKFGKPVVWRLPDMFPFTGGCHYSGECQAYEEQCGACPFLGSRAQHDVSWFNLRRKRQAIARIEKLEAVAPSRWLADCASRSSVFAGRTVHTVNTGVDLNAFAPLEKNAARQLLGLVVDPGQKVIAFGAVKAQESKRKGGALLYEAIRTMVAQTKGADKYKLLVFGASEIPENDLPVETMLLGHLSDDLTLRIVYSAADVFVVPSLEENLPNTGLEALACGTPVVGFYVGGMPDLVQEGRNGSLAKNIDALSLAERLEWVLQDEVRLAALCRNARIVAEESFDLERQASDYLRIYEAFLER